MQDKIIVITGASDGIGAAAARALVAKGAQVAIVGRSAKKTKAIAKELGTAYYVADFSELKQVRELAAQLQKAYPRIDILANNAGGIMGDRKVTVDGHELTFQVNHLAPFLLTNLLLKSLLAGHAKVINTSSIANKLLSNFDIDDLDLEHGYTSRKAYGNAKLANILFIKELHRRYHNQGISAAAFHPGIVATGFSKKSGGMFELFYQTSLKKLLLSPQKGADTLVWLAENDDWQSGEYYHKRKPAKAIKTAYDAELAKQLWQRSAAITGL